MDDKTNYPKCGIKRHASNREKICRLLAISTRNLEWTDHQTKVLDINATGFGVECDKALENAVIWLKESVWGHKCGCLVWCKQSGSVYRAGIQFVSLFREDEDYLRQQIEQLESHKPFPDPRRIILEIVASL